MSVTRLFAAVALLGTACGGPSNPQVSLSVPSFDNFAAVDLVLEPNCGTLDCHGAPARNFRIYGQFGLRLFSTDVVGGAATRPEELQATYQSMTALEPEALSAVFQSRGSGVEHWIIVSKARGLERHKGGVRLPAASPGDKCIVSWASGAIDMSACLADSFGPIPLAGQSW